MSMDDIESMMGSSDFVLDSQYEIENVIISIQEIEGKVKFFKGLKQHRARRIDSDIKELEERAARMRQVVLRTMVATDPKKKTMHFPGTAKVTRRAGKTAWKIKDEKKVLEFMELQGLKKEVVETKEVIVKKEANKIFERFYGQSIDVPGTERENAADGISISYEDSSSPSVTKSKASPIASETSVEGISEQDL